MQAIETRQPSVELTSIPKLAPITCVYACLCVCSDDVLKHPAILCVCVCVCERERESSACCNGKESLKSLSATVERIATEISLEFSLETS